MRGIRDFRICKEVELKHEPKDHVEFDELVIDDFLHIEKMDARAYWARIGDVWMWIEKNRQGEVIVTVDRGQYGPERGKTMRKGVKVAD